MATVVHYMWWGVLNIVPPRIQEEVERAMNRTALRTISLLAILALFSVWAFGQAETGLIAGTVKDASGAVVTGAKVTVKSINTGLTRDGITNSAGIFTIPNLRPDNYEVVIEAPGFQKVTQTVRVAVGAATDVSTQLKVGGAATTVEVTGTGEAATVNTENATMSAAIGSQQVNELPTMTRNPYDLVQTAGNVVQDTNSNRGAGYSINGQRSASTDILLDGGQNVDLFTATVGQTVPLDSVQEFSVLTNNFSAEYGRASGGIVNVVTKSGTNAFHGSAYEYNRLSALSSNTYQNDATDTKKGGFTRNQFGFAVGGPIIKNKLFFFNNTEWIRVRSNSPISYDIIDPSSYSQLAPASQAFFSQYGNFAPGVTTTSKFPCGGGSSLTCAAVTFPVVTDAGGGAPQNTWMEVARVDYNMSDKNTIFGRYASYKESDFPGYVNASPYAGYNTGQTNYDQNVTINWTHVFTPSVVNTFKVIYNRINGPNQPLASAPIGPTLYTSSSIPALENGLPLVFPGYSETTPGNAIPFGGPQNVYQLIDDLSWTKGKHQFKFGGSFIKEKDNRTFGAYENAVEYLGSKLSTGLANLTAGTIYQFQGAIYPQGEYPCPKNEQGQVQVSPACTLTLPVGPPAFNRNYIYNDFSLYGTDAWKVTPRLTLNLGLRWEYYGVQHNSNTALDSNFVFGPGATEFNQIRNGQVKLASQGGVFWHPDYDNIAPRIGFAYDVFGDGTTSIRGGYGISYERNFGNVTYNTIQNPPNYGVVSLQSLVDVPYNMPVFTDNAGPLAGTGTKALPAVSQRAINQNIQTAYAETWDFSIQRQIMKNSVLALDYAGSHGIHLYDIANVNPASGGNPDGFGGGNTYLGDAHLGNRINYQYSNMNFRSDNGFSHYNALNVRWTSTNLLNKGLNLTVNYTWSHAMDNLSSTFSEIYGGQSGVYYLGYIDAFNPKLDYGNADFNVPNRFVMSGVWELPWMKNASNAVARAVLGGWAMGSIFNAHSGNYYSVYDCSNFNGTSCPLWVPNQTSPLRGGNMGAAGANLFNYMQLPSSDGTVVNLGDSLGLPTCTGLVHNGCTYTQSGLPYPGRNAYPGPGYWNIDMNFYKNFKITERFTMQFRGEMYNIFNHHNLYITGLNLDASSLATPFVQAEKGGIYGYAGQPSDERRNIQFALKLMF